MKKAGIFAALIASVLLLLQLYNFKLYGYTGGECFVFDEKAAAEALAAEDAEEVPEELPLLRYEAASPVWIKGDKLFIGEAREALPKQFPIYMNDGQWLYSFSDEMLLVTSDFEELNSYEGLYVTDGSSYNSDFELADPDEFLFAAVGDGLFMNVQPLVIHSSAQRLEIAANSLLKLSEEQISYYSYAETALRYGSYEDLWLAEAEIGSVRMSYEELLKRLLKQTEETGGRLQPESEAETTEEEESEAPQEEETAQLSEEAGAQGENAGDAEAPAEKDAASGGEAFAEEEAAESAGGEASEGERASAEDSAADGTEQPESGEAAGETGSVTSGENGGALRETEEPTHPPYPGKPKEWSFGGGSGEDGGFAEDESGSVGRPQGGSGNNAGGEAGDGESQENGTGGEGGDGSGSGTGGESGSPGTGGSGQGGSGTGGSGEGGGPVFQKPEAELKNFRFGVYDAEAELEYKDPAQSIIKGVRVIFYEKGESRSSYRKLFRTPGKIGITPLKPGTEYEAEAYFDYAAADGSKQREVFFERQPVGETLTIDALRKISLTQRWDGSVLFPSAIVLSGVQILNAQGAASPSETEGYDATPYIASAQLRFKKSGSLEWSGVETSLSASYLSQLKRGDAVLWHTAEVLAADTEYDYELRLFDRYGNELPLSADSAAKGSARTAKRAPTAAISVDRESPINALGLRVNINNPDNAVYLHSDGVGNYPYLTVSYADKPELPIAFTTKKTGEERLTRYALTENSNDIVLTSLLPSKSYIFSVCGSYELMDKLEHRNELIKQQSYTTERLQSLGTVSFVFDTSSLKADAANVEARLQGRISEALLPFLFEYRLTLIQGSGTRFVLPFQRELLEQIGISAGETVTFSADIIKAADPELLPLELLFGEDPDAETQEAIRIAKRQLASVSISLSKDAPASTDNVWKAITGIQGKLRFTLRELPSATDHKLELRSYAKRGGIDGGAAVPEEVTGRYYSHSLKTMRKRAQISYDSSFINGNTATFYELRVEDPDASVTGGGNGKVYVRLSQVTNGTVKAMQSFRVEELNARPSVQFHNLEEGTEYYLDILAEEYNEGFSGATAERMKLLYLEDTKTEQNRRIRFTAANNLSGTLELLSLQRGFAAEQPEDEVCVSGANLVDLNMMEEFRYIGESNKQIKFTDSINYSTTGYIPVEPGKTYLANGVYGSFYLFDKDKNYLGSHGFGQGLTALPKLLRIPADAAYVRFSAEYSKFAGLYFGEAKNTEEAADGNLLSAQKTTFVKGYYFDDLGREAAGGNYARSDYIKVEAGSAYVLLRDRKISYKEAVNGDNKRLFFFDENKKFISRIDRNIELSYTFVVPEGAVYLAFNEPVKLAATPHNAEISETETAAEAGFALRRLSGDIYGEDLLQKDGVVWHDAMQVDGYNRYVRQTSELLGYCDYIAVESAASYFVTNANGVQIFDAEKHFIGYSAGYHGSQILRMPDDAAYIRVNRMLLSMDGERSPSVRKILPAYDRDRVNVVLSSSLTDLNGSIRGESGYELLVEQDDELAETIPVQFDESFAESGTHSMTLSLSALRQHDYTVTMQVRVGGRMQSLSKVSFETERVTNIIRSQSALRALNFASTEDYIVTGPLELRRDVSFSLRLYGTIDFGGNRITMKNRTYLFETVYEGACVKNLVADRIFDDPAYAVGNTHSLFHINYGTIQDSVLRLKLKNGRDNSNFAGLCRDNYGVIERVAVQLSDTMDVLNQATAGVMTNQTGGVLRDCYVLAEEQHAIQTTKAEGTRNYLAGLCYVNYGTIENVYGALNIRDKKSGGTPNSMGILVGENNGNFRNGFSVGRTYSDDIPPVKEGPAIGKTGSSAGGSARTERAYYIETGRTVTTPRYLNNYNRRAVAASLTDAAWLSARLSRNGDSAFELAAAASGYYPQLKMPQSMEGAQPLMRMPQDVQETRVRVLSAALIEQTEDRALVRMTFDNGGRMEIKSLQLATKDITEENKVTKESFVKDSAAVRIIEQGVDDKEGGDGAYYALMEISEPSRFRSDYYVDSYTYGIAGNDALDSTVEAETYSWARIPVPVAFYRPIRSVDDWRTALSVNFDVYGNYRFCGELDFSNASALADMKKLMLTPAFYGKLSGSYTAADGSKKTAVLKNMTIDGGRGFILNLRGELSDLCVENLTLKAENHQIAGFVQVSTGAKLRNIHLKDVTLEGNGVFGALAGQAGESEITGCSVTDVSLRTTRRTDGGSTTAGALCGLLYRGTSLERSYAQGVEINAHEISASSGIGGLAGRMQTGASQIIDCYAEGRILAENQYIGGICGSAIDGRTIKGCYSKVDIDAFGSSVGGLCGNAQFSSMPGNVVFGDVFVHSLNATAVHRVVGNRINNSSLEIVTGSYAYRDQLLQNGEKKETGTDASADADDAEGLLSGTALLSADTYRDTLGWTRGSYDFAPLSEGELPMLSGNYPYQREIPFKSAELKLSTAQFTMNADMDGDIKKVLGLSEKPSDFPFKETYTINVTLTGPAGMSTETFRERYEIRSVSMEGMDVRETLYGKKAYTEDYRTLPETGQPYAERRYPFFGQLLGGDVYCLKAEVYDRESGESFLLSAAADPQKTIETEIANAAQWNEVMRVQGRSYGNFVLVGNIDESTLPEGEKLIRNVRVNSLRSRSSAAPHKILNVEQSFDAKETTGTLIEAVMSGLSDVGFENIVWKAAAESDAHDRVGIIGNNHGVIERVSFKNIDIFAGKQTGSMGFAGCVTNNYGFLQDIELSDIRINAYGNNVGGLCGLSQTPVRRIRATGRLEKEGSGDDAVYRSSYEIQGRGSVGGIVGSGQATEQIRVDGIRVLGNPGPEYKNAFYYIGGVTGNGTIPKSHTNEEESAENSSSIKNSVIEITRKRQGSNPIAEPFTAALGYVGGAAGSGNIYYVEAENLVVRSDEETSAERVGGIAGNGYAYKSSLKTVPAKESGAPDGAQNENVIERSLVQGGTYVGGILGFGYGTGNSVDNLTVRAFGDYAGGISGSANSTISHSTADRMELSARSIAGGIIGSGLNAENNMVTRSLIKTSASHAGGIIGQTTNNQISYGNGVIDTLITAGVNTETNASYAGGIIGESKLLHSAYGNYILDSSRNSPDGSNLSGQAMIVKAAGDYAGGIIGSADGGAVYRNISAGAVEAGQYAGGIAGRFMGDRKDSNTNAKGKLYHNYTLSDVAAEDYAAGLIAAYDGGTEAYKLTGDAFTGNLVLGSISLSADENGDVSGTRADFLANTVNAGSYSLTEAQNSRVYEYAKLNGKTAKEHLEAGLSEYPGNGTPKDYYWETFRPESAGGSVKDENADTEKLAQTLLATADSLADRRFYNNNAALKAIGGMGWEDHANSVVYDMMERLPEPDPAKPLSADRLKLGFRLKMADGTTSEILVTDANREQYRVQAVEADVRTADGDTFIPEAEVLIPEELFNEITKIEWYRARDSFTQGSGRVISNETKIPLAGRGYYFCRVSGFRKDNGNSYYYHTPIIRVDSQAYMPMVNSANIDVEGGMEGILPTVTAETPIAVYKGGDWFYYGGIPVPSGMPEDSAAETLQETGQTARIYPVDADVINVELSADYVLLSGLTVKLGGTTVFEGKPEKRVMSFPYNFCSEVVVTLRTGGTAETAAAPQGAEPALKEAEEPAARAGGVTTVRADADELRRTVMADGDTYYYSYDRCVMGADGEALSEPAVHLAKGKALMTDGSVAVLSDGTRTPMRQLVDRAKAGGSAAVDCSLPESIPMAEGSAGESLLRTFLGFTEVTENGTTGLREQQLFVREGELISVKEGRSDRGMVLDVYNGGVYASFLTEQGTLKDLGDSLKRPEEFSARRIAHMSSTLETEEPVVLLRYQNGTAAGFNYITGEPLELLSAVSDPSLLSFVGDFTESLLFRSEPENLAFTDLKILRDELKVRPLEEAAGKAEMTPDSAVGAASEEEKTDGMSTEDGGSTESGEAGEKSGEEAVSGTDDKAAAEAGASQEETGAQPEAAEDSTEAVQDGGETGDAAASEVQDASGAAEHQPEEAAAEPEGTLLSEDDAFAETGSNTADKTAAYPAGAEAEYTKDGETVSGGAGEGETEAGNTQANAAESNVNGADDAASGGSAGAGAGNETAKNSDAPAAAADGEAPEAGGTQEGIDADASSNRTEAAQNSGNAGDAAALEAQEALRTAETAPEADASESSGKQPAASGTGYIFSFDAENGEAALYDAELLLSGKHAEAEEIRAKDMPSRKSDIMDVEARKVAEDSSEEEKQGVSMIVSVILAAIGLCILLVRRKRSDIKFFIGFLIVLALSAFAVQKAHAEGFSEENGAWYYIDADGERMRESWIYSEGIWYYLGADGRMKTETSQEVAGKLYFFDESGAMLTGWVSDTFEAVDDGLGTAYRDGGLYYADADGAAVRGWKYLPADDLYAGRSRQWFYFGQNGRKYAGRSLTESDAKGNRYSYRFDENGVMYQSKLISEAAGGNGAAGGGQWLKHVPGSSEDSYAADFGRERWYYLTAGEQLVKDQLRNIDGKRYLFDKNGIMQTGLCRVDKNGRYVQTVWRAAEGVDADRGGVRSAYEEAARDGGTLMYFDDSGARRSGEVRLSLGDGTASLYFLGSGAAVHGVRDGKLYDRGVCVEADRSLRYEIFELDGAEYLVNSSGKIMGSGIYKAADDVSYEVKKNGGSYEITKR